MVRVIDINYDPKECSKACRLISSKPSKTQQSMREEADINTIVRRFGLTGQMPTGIRMPQFGDFTSVVDYQTALNAVIAAQESFMRLPADIRKQFGDDAGAFVEFCSDPKNEADLIKMGLASKKETTETVPASPAPASGVQPPTGAAQG